MCRHFWVFPWFAWFYSDVATVTSSGGSERGPRLPFSFSPKIINYVVGANLMLSSNANMIAGLSGIVRIIPAHIDSLHVIPIFQLAGVLVRNNFLWLKDFHLIPGSLSNLCYK